MNYVDQVKLAAFLSKKPSMSDYGRVGGRTVLEGGLGGYGGAGLMALLAGLISHKAPNALSAKAISSMIGGGSALGALGGGLHGYSAAMENAKARLGPMGQLKRLIGM